MQKKFFVIGKEFHVTISGLKNEEAVMAFASGSRQPLDICGKD